MYSVPGLQLRTPAMPRGPSMASAGGASIRFQHDARHLQRPKVGTLSSRPRLALAAAPHRTAPHRTAPHTHTTSSRASVHTSGCQSVARSLALSHTFGGGPRLFRLVKTVSAARISSCVFPINASSRPPSGPFPLFVNPLFPFPSPLYRDILPALCLAHRPSFDAASQHPLAHAEAARREGPPTLASYLAHRSSTHSKPVHHQRTHSPATPPSYQRGPGQGPWCCCHTHRRRRRRRSASGTCRSISTNPRRPIFLAQAAIVLLFSAAVLFLRKTGTLGILPRLATRASAASSRRLAEPTTRRHSHHRQPLTAPAPGAKSHRLLPSLCFFWSDSPQARIRH